MEKNSVGFVKICHFMKESGFFGTIGGADAYAVGYSMPEVYAVTSSAVLYRVRKAGKYFIIKTAKDNTAQSQALLQREYEHSIALSHPNIATVFTYEQHTVVGAGIVMEYVDGRTLAEFIEENPSLEMRERVFEQLVSAVAYIHRSGLVHNDIKPGNILVTRTDNDVRLIDFGLADSDACYLARTLGCTPEYASPELLIRDKDIDARSDIYSLGVVMKKIFGKRFSRISSRCLRQEKDKRYSNAEELLDAFKHRNRPVKVAIALVAAMLVLVPLSMYVVTEFEERRNIAGRDAMIVEVERAVDTCYRATADSISNAIYFEFATNHIVAFYENVAVFQKENIAPVADAELNSILSASYMNKLNGCQEKLWQQANTLPSFYKSGLPAEEVLYYDSLVSYRLPYVPYNIR